MWVKRLFLNIMRLFSFFKTYFYNQGVLGENYMKDSPRKKSVRLKRESGSAQKIKIINLDDLDLASLVEKGARTLR